MSQQHRLLWVYLDQTHPSHVDKCFLDDKRIEIICLTNLFDTFFFIKKNKYNQLQTAITIFLAIDSQFRWKPPDSP